MPRFAPVTNTILPIIVALCSLACVMVLLLVDWVACSAGHGMSATLPTVARPSSWASAFGPSASS